MLFDDPKIRDAGREGAVANARKRGWRGNHLESWAIHGDADSALTAAVAALDRDALVEAAGRALCDYSNQNERECHRLAPKHRPCLLVYEEWREMFDREAEFILRGIGLIPEAPRTEDER